MRRPLFIPENRIRELMHDHSLSQRDLATMVGVTQKAVCDWINGTSSLPMYAAIVLAQRFECSIDYLVCKTEENRKPMDNGRYNAYYNK